MNGFREEQLTLTMPSLQCKKTTENGSDEIYQIIIYQKSDGVRDSRRLPLDHLWHSANVSGLDNDIHWGEILTFDLAPGDRIDILGLIMESDEGTPDMYKNVASELFATSFFQDLINGKTPTFQIIPGILARIKNQFDIDNADDWIGGYICTFQNTGTGITKTYRTAINLTNPSNAQQPVPTSGSNKTTYKFAGDGSLYIAKLNLLAPKTAPPPRQ